MIKRYSKEIQKDLDLFVRRWQDPGVLDMEASTSGSTGSPKIISIPKSSMKVSASISNQFFGLQKGMNVMLCMPMQSIAAQMLVVRSILAKANLVVVKPQKDPFVEISKEEKVDFVSLTPYQLAHILQNTTSKEKLKQVSIILLGGAPLSIAMEGELIKWNNRIYLSYGMTETLSHIALREIAPIHSDVFRLLPGYQIQTSDSGASIRVPWSDSLLKTSDILELETDQSFRVLGRCDNVINSGGVKIFPEELEHCLSNIIDCPYCVTYKSHKSLGSAVALMTEEPIDIQKIERVLRKVNPHFIPKYYFVHKIPRVKNGKIDRQMAAEIVADLDENR